MSGFPWHLQTLNPLVAFGLLLLLGVIGGQIATRVARLPGVTGYILIGFFIGPSGLGVIRPEVLDEASLFIELGFGLALFEIGRRIDFRWLFHERALLITCMASAAITYFGLDLFFVSHGLTGTNAALPAAVGMAAAPPVVLDIVRESQAEGQVSERLEAATGINTLLALIVFALVLTLHGYNVQTSSNKMLVLIWSVLGAVLLGLLAGEITSRLNHLLSAGKRDIQRVLLFAMIALVVGLAKLLHTLPSLALMIVGMSMRNQNQTFTVAEPDLLPRNTFLFVVLFVAIGAQIDPGMLVKFWPLALGFVGLRFAFSILTWMASARGNGLNLKQGGLLGAALMPLSGSAFALATTTDPLLIPTPSSGLILAALCILDIAGPVVTHFALRLSGETRRGQ
jgi:Kef-type K+ transport system membrane component KefB